MWRLFRKKQDIDKKKEKHIYEDVWNKLKPQYPLGRKFNYLGRDMTVIGHRDFFPGIMYIPPTYPAILCEYVDNHGIIHEKVFGTSTWGMLDI